MSKHSILQNDVKELLQLYRWKVIENVEGKSKSGKRQEAGISDLLAIKLPRVLWIEIKITPDKLRESQVEFKDKIDDCKNFGEYHVVKDNLNNIKNNLMLDR